MGTPTVTAKTRLSQSHRLSRADERVFKAFLVIQLPVGRYVSKDYPFGMASLEDLYRLRRRPAVEKTIDAGFKLTSALLATVVALVLLFILYVVFTGALDSMGR